MEQVPPYGDMVDWPYSSIHRDIARGMVEPEWAGVVAVGRFGEVGG